jgi:UDP-3-O-[3-hydroxymyristoyl] N-acetylglucosamine deacetylase
MVRLQPFAQSGIYFRRTDKERDDLIPAVWRQVSNTNFCTTLSGDDGTSIVTSEHLLSALWALGIGRLLIEIDGPELPILDGSSSPWLEAIQRVGVKGGGLRDQVRLLKTVSVTHGRSSLSIRPSLYFSVDMTAVVGAREQHYTYLHTGLDSFKSQIAPARTFTMERCVKDMRARGLIRGGSMDNALVMNESGVPLNPEGERLENECARHKVLDFLGDFALAPRLTGGQVVGYASGHTLNVALMRTIFSDPTAWEYTKARSSVECVTHAAEIGLQ